MSCVVASADCNDTTAYDATGAIIVVAAVAAAIVLIVLLRRRRHR